MVDFAIGGIHSIRGFNESTLFANQYAFATLEYRLLLEKNAFMAVFWENGFFEELEGEILTLNALGAGINFETSAGIFELSVAVGKQGENPLDFSSPKVHLGYISSF